MIIKKFIQTLFIILILIKSSSIIAMSAAEEVVLEAAEKSGIEAGELAEAGVRAALTENVAESMGISVEDIAKLPPETREAFVNQLSEAFGKFKTGFAEGKFTPELKLAVGNARTQFLGDVEKISESTGGFSSFKRDFFINKFKIEPMSLKPFTPELKPKLPIKTEPIKQLSPTEIAANEDLAKAQANMFEARDNLSYALQVGDAEKVAQAGKDLENADVRVKAINNNLVQSQEKLLQEDVAKLNASKTTNEKIENREIVAKQEADTELAQRSSTDMQYKYARDNYKGSPDAQNKIKAAENKVAKAKTTEEKTAAQKELDQINEQYSAEAKGTQGQLKDAKSARDAAQKEVTEKQTQLNKLKSSNASKEQIDPVQAELDQANARLSEREATYKNMDEVDKAAKEIYEEKYQQWLEKGSFSRARWGWKIYERAKNLLIEQIVSGIVGGFAFSIPNFIIGPIESSENTKAEYDNLMMPRKFGRIWMQIPAQLINSRLPSGSKFIYVKLDRNPGETVTKHDENADKPSYLQTAQAFMSRDDYDRYAESAISDPAFPNAMVNPETGFFFNWDNTAADSEMKVVPLLEVGKNKRVEKPLSNHLDDQAGQIRTGMSKEIFTEDANYTAAYAGSPDIADRFDSQAKDAIVFKDAPELRAGAIMSQAVNQGGGQFGGPKPLFVINPLRRLTPNQMQLLGSSEEPAKDYPYIATGYYVYQTADTPPVQFARQNNQPKKDALWDYVVVLDRNGQQIPFLEPIIDSAGNATYVPNIAINSMISLVTGDKYDLTGRTNKASDNELKNITIHPDMQNQISVMQEAIKQLIQDEKYGPFTVGNAKLEIIDKQSIDNGVFVYKRTDRTIEGGFTDYLVAMGPNADASQLIMNQLPNQNIIYFVSLVTSRFYDQNMMPITKNMTFYVNQAADKSFFVSNKSTDPVYSYQTSLYEAYLDPILNKIKPTADQIQSMIKRGATQQVAELLPIPNQWILSSVGLYASYDGSSKSGMRIGDFLNQKSPQIRSTIDSVYTQWKKAYPNIPAKYREAELGPFQWVNFGPVQISFMATSLDDIQNGNYLYQSKQFPDEYLALADAAGSTASSLQNFASEFNVSNPQRYAISLSSGAVYDHESAGGQTASINDLKGLFDAAQRSKNFLPALAKKIKDSQLTYQASLQSSQIGTFGPFQLFIDLPDLESGQFIYADVSSIINKYNQPLNDADRKKMLADVTDYYITMQTPGHVRLGDPSLDTSKIIYGLKLGGDTDYIISYITGAMYDRGGAFAGFYEKIDPRAAGTGIELGFQKWIFANVMKTWNAIDFNAATKQNIDRLTKQTIQQLQEQEKEISDLRLAEAKRSAPLGGDAETASNMIANLKAAPYVSLLLTMSPPRYVKSLNNKYYAVSPDNNVIVDFNVGVANTDNKLGKIYDGAGQPQLELTGWTLDSVRLYNGVTVGPNGQQSISIGIEHPKIPVNRMVRLDRAPLANKLAAAESAFNAQEIAYRKRATTTKNLSVTDLANFQKNMLSAATSVGFARQEMSALPAVENAGKQLGNINISFYYNEDTANYFVRMQSAEIDIFFDLLSGYGFNPDGTPHIARLPVYHNTDASASADDYFIGALNDIGLFAAVYPALFVPQFKFWVQNGAEEISEDGNTINYPVTSDEGTTNNVLYNRIKNTYDTYSVGISEVIKVGSYAKTNLFATRLNYALTKTKANPSGEYIAGDAPTVPVILIWDGKPDLNFQFIIYPFDVDSVIGTPISNIVPLKPAGAGRYTANTTLLDGSPKTITIAKEQKQIDRLSGQWITITDGDKTFQFLYNTSLLDPSFVASCPTEIPTATDIITMRTKLGYLKQCEWKLNVVVDSFGVPRLVKELPGYLPNSKITVPATVPNQASIQNIMNQKAQSIKQDDVGNRFVYQLNAQTDANWPYFESRFDGWYVDLSSGILYDTILDPGTYGYYPRGSLKPSQLTALLDRLNVSVIMNPQGVYELRYRGAPTTQQPTTPPMTRRRR